MFTLSNPVLYFYCSSSFLFHVPIYSVPLLLYVIIIALPSALTFLPLYALGAVARYSKEKGKRKIVFYLNQYK